MTLTAITVMIHLYWTPTKPAEHAPERGQTETGWAAPVNIPVSKIGLIICYRGPLWYGQPVHWLTNDTDHALANLSVASWSNDLLPILFIGIHVPQDLKMARTDQGPPFTLPAGGSAWFVGATPRPSSFTVMWLENGQAQSATVESRP